MVRKLTQEEIVFLIRNSSGKVIEAIFGNPDGSVRLIDKPENKWAFDLLFKRAQESKDYVIEKQL